MFEDLIIQIFRVVKSKKIKRRINNITDKEAKELLDIISFNLGT